MINLVSLKISYTKRKSNFRANLLEKNKKITIFSEKKNDDFFTYMKLVSVGTAPTNVFRKGAKKWIFRSVLLPLRFRRKENLGSCGCVALRKKYTLPNLLKNLY